MSRCPCKDCFAPKRKLLCHAECKEYKAWSKEREEMIRQKNLEHDSKFNRPPEKEYMIRRKMRWK